MAASNASPAGRGLASADGTGLGMSLGASGAFGASGPAGSPRAGIKRELQHLREEVGRQADVIARHEKEMESSGSDSAKLTRDVDTALKAMIRDLRAEFTQKIAMLASEVSTLQKQINVMKGESNVLSQQQKDVSKRVTEVGDQLRDLAVEVLGDD